MDIVDGSCIRSEGGDQSEGCLYVASYHLWSVEELIPERGVCKWEAAQQRGDEWHSSDREGGAEHANTRKGKR